MVCLLRIHALERSISPFPLGRAQVGFDSTNLRCLTNHHLNLHPLENNDGESWKLFANRLYDLGVSITQKRKASQDLSCAKQRALLHGISNFTAPYVLLPYNNMETTHSVLGLSPNIWQTDINGRGKVQSELVQTSCKKMEINWLVLVLQLTISKERIQFCLETNYFQKLGCLLANDSRISTKLV